MKKLLSYILLMFVALFVGIESTKAFKIYYRPSDSDYKKKYSYAFFVKENPDSKYAVYPFVQKTNDKITDGKVYETDINISKIVSEIGIITYSKGKQIIRKKYASNVDLSHLSNTVLTYDGHIKGVDNYSSPKKYTFYYHPLEKYYKKGYSFKVKYVDKVCSKIYLALGAHDVNNYCEEINYESKLKKTSKKLRGIPIYSATVKIYGDEAQSIQYLVIDKNGKVVTSVINNDVKLSDYDNKVVDYDGELENVPGNISKDEQHNNVKLDYVACGGNGVTVSDICNDNAGSAAYDIPAMLPALTSFLVNALKIATPIILIFIGMIQIIKALASTSDDELKKAQSSLIKKVIIAVFIFFTVAITQFIVDKVSDAYSSDEKSSTNSCLSCFLNNNCKLKYYRLGEKCQERN